MEFVNIFLVFSRNPWALKPSFWFFEENEKNKLIQEFSKMPLLYWNRKVVPITILVYARQDNARYLIFAAIKSCNRSQNWRIGLEKKIWFKYFERSLECWILCWIQFGFIPLLAVINVFNCLFSVSHGTGKVSSFI